MKKNNMASWILGIICVLCLTVGYVALRAHWSWYTVDQLNEPLAQHFVMSAMEVDDEMQGGRGRRLGDAVLRPQLCDQFEEIKGKITREIYMMIAVSADESGGYALCRDGAIVAYIPGKKDRNEGLIQLIPDFPIEGTDEFIGSFAQPGPGGIADRKVVQFEIERTEEGSKAKVWRDSQYELNCFYELHDPGSI